MITISVTLSKSFGVPEKYDENGELDLYAMIDDIPIPGEISTYLNVDGTLDPEVIKLMDDWYIDDFEVMED